MLLDHLNTFIFRSLGQKSPIPRPRLSVLPGLFPEPASTAIFRCLSPSTSRIQLRPGRDDGRLWSYPKVSSFPLADHPGWSSLYSMLNVS